MKVFMKSVVLFCFYFEFYKVEIFVRRGGLVWNPEIPINKIKEGNGFRKNMALVW